MAGEGGNYFVDYKRGEVIELKNHLRSSKIQKDPNKMRDVIKKVVAYMTLGIDVSSLFSEMIMATHTADMVQRKLVYLYLCTYAAEKQDLSLLAVNTLQRDCTDTDPMVRGLALRSLCNLRVPNLTEYVVRPIRAGLADNSGYVRKVAVLGVAKLSEIAPDVVKNSDIVDILYNMIKDPDPSVVSNVLSTLDIVLADEGGMSVMENIILYLLNRINSFRPWGQVKVLEICSRFQPESEQQMFDLMNLLDDRLRQSNSAVVLSTVNLFLKLTESIPQVHSLVYNRIKEPLITLVCSQIPGVAYSVLSTVLLLSEKNPSCFSDRHKLFFNRFSDASHVKSLKLKILTNISTRGNAQEILNELAEYVTDHDQNISRGAVRAISEIAVRVSSSMETAMEHLLSFLQLSSEAVVAETLVAVKNVLRKYPNVGNVLPALRDAMKSVHEEEAKCAVIFLLGAHGNDITDAPYILENFIDDFEEQPKAAKLELIPAAVNLFFKRPPEVQDMLGRLLAAAIADPAVDVRDRAYFHYTCLSTSVQNTQEIVQSEQIPIDHIHPPNRKLVNKVFEELNSLAVIFHKPSSQFVKTNNDDDYYDEDYDDEDDEEEEDEDDAEPAMMAAPVQTNTNTATSGSSYASAVPASAPAPMDDIFGDLFSSSSAKPAAQAPAQPTFSLQSNVPRPDQQQFQGTWENITVQQSARYAAQVQTSQLAQFQKNFSGSGFSIFASGKQGNSAKFFLYSQTSDQVWIFGELVVAVSNGQFQLTLKSENVDYAQKAKEVFVQAVGSNLAGQTSI